MNNIMSPKVTTTEEAEAFMAALVRSQEGQESLADVRMLADALVWYSEDEDPQEFFILATPKIGRCQ